MGFEQMPDINKMRKEIDEKNAEMGKKERKRMEEEYERSSEQEKPTEEKLVEKPEEKSEKKAEEIKTEEKVEEKPAEVTKEESKEKIKEEPKAEKVKEEPKNEKKVEEKESLEKEITKRYYDELEKIKQMPDNTGELKKEKTEKCFQLIDSWTDMAYLDDYKGIQNIFSELDRLKPSIFLYDLKRAQTVNKVGLTMALNYKEWGLEDKEKLKIIKNFVNKQSKEKIIFYSKDKTFEKIAQILASEDMPFKGNIDVIVKNIENPNIKSKTIAGIADIEKESIEKKKQSLQDLKKDMERDKLPPDKITMEQLEKLGIDPKAVSEILPKLNKILENPEVQEEFKKLGNTIEKITKEKGEISESVAKAKEHIEKKESPWRTALGTVGWSILLFLVLFMLAELKGVDYLAKTKIDTTGGKKK